MSYSVSKLETALSSVVSQSRVLQDIFFVVYVLVQSWYRENVKRFSLKVGVKILIIFRIFYYPFFLYFYFFSIFIDTTLIINIILPFF